MVYSLRSSQRDSRNRWQPRSGTVKAETVLQRWGFIRDILSFVASKYVFFVEASKVASTKTLVLKHDFLVQGGIRRPTFRKREPGCFARSRFAPKIASLKKWCLPFVQIHSGNDLKMFSISVSVSVAQCKLFPRLFYMLSCHLEAAGGRLCLHLLRKINSNCFSRLYLYLQCTVKVQIVL